MHNSPVAERVRELVLTTKQQVVNESITSPVTVVVTESVEPVAPVVEHTVEPTAKPTLEPVTPVEDIKSSDLKVTEYNGQLVIDSREIAKMFGCRHCDLLQNIRNKIDYLKETGVPFVSENIIESTFINLSNVQHPCYKLTRKGCELFTVQMRKNKQKFIVAYTEKFDEVENQSKVQSKAQQTVEPSVVTLLTDFTTEQAETFVKEHAKPIEPIYVPPTIVTQQKLHNDISVPVVQQMKQNQDELIKTQVNDDNEIVVSGRELHEFLEVKTRYDKWIARMIGYGFTENQDYLLVAQKRPINNPKNPYTEITDHALKLDMAKEISMIQRNEKGKQARQYFIEIEKKYKAQAVGHAPVPIASYMIENPIERAKQWIVEQQEKMLLEEKVQEQSKVIEEKEIVIESQKEIIHVRAN